MMTVFAIYTKPLSTGGTHSTFAEPIRDVAQFAFFALLFQLLFHDHHHPLHHSKLPFSYSHVEKHYHQKQRKVLHTDGLATTNVTNRS